ncbi:MAG: hypothetical protein CMO44_17975 [Verrucomicrobiales bacterium]|nr:hypothetical protein [Verrucomicrobiales bacterium]
MEINKKRSYEKADAESMSSILKKIRRKSYGIKWDKSIEVPCDLKKLYKSRLSLNQTQFSGLESQLYITNCVHQKKNEKYKYPADTYEFPNDAYVKLVRYLSLTNLLHLCIWKFFNKYMAKPNKKLRDLFLKQYAAEEMEATFEVYKFTAVKINEIHTIQRVNWTVQQRNAAKHTRDYFVKGLKEQKPMLSDLNSTESNNAMIREFVMGLLKANILDCILCEICCRQLGVEMSDFDIPVEALKSLEEKDYIPLKFTTFNKEKRVSNPQRTSITDFKPLQKDIQAATKIQRMYRRRLKKMKRAVQTIENFWEPHRLENIAIRIEIQEDMLQDVEEADRELEARDLLKYAEFVREIKDDYRTVLKPEPRAWQYWLTVIVIVLPIVIGSFFLQPSQDIVTLCLLGYVLFQSLTPYRLDKKYLWIQTLGLLILTCIFLNDIFPDRNGAIRFIPYLIIMPTGKKWWVIYLALVVVRVGASFIIPNFELKAWPELYIYVYDIYFISTAVSASRQGTPIQMLHKVMINIVFLIIVGILSALGCMWACLWVGSA